MPLPFNYSAASESALEALLSPDRLSSYKIASGGLLGPALELYVWNTAASAAFYGPLQGVEVGLRNKCDMALAAKFGANWPDDPAFLSINERFAKDISNAKEQIIANWARSKVPPGTPKTDFYTTQCALEAQARAPGSGVVTTPRIIADLSFGFWVAMFKGDYQYTLYGPVLSSFLPVGTKRSAINGLLNRLKDLRNRIAHHEPIHRVDLKRAYEELAQVASFLSTDLASWIEYHSRCALFVNDRPRQRQQF